MFRRLSKLDLCPPNQGDQEREDLHKSERARAVTRSVWVGLTGRRV